MNLKQLYYDNSPPSSSSSYAETATLPGLIRYLSTDNLSPPRPRQRTSRRKAIPCCIAGGERKGERERDGGRGREGGRESEEGRETGRKVKGEREIEIWVWSERLK